MKPKSTTAVRKRYGRSKISEEDRIDGALADEALRAITADPSQLVPFDEVLRQIGLEGKLRRGR